MTEFALLIRGLVTGHYPPPSHSATVTTDRILLAIFLFSSNLVARQKSTAYTQHIIPIPGHVLAHSAMHSLILNLILTAEKCLTYDMTTDTLYCVCEYVNVANGEISYTYLRTMDAPYHVCGNVSLDHYVGQMTYYTHYKKMAAHHCVCADVASVCSAD
jgi:hypothetical protein